MPRNVRCALIQASNALSTERPLAQIRKAMIDKHLKLIAQAAKKKTQILCLQELFYGPYFCAEQNARWYELTERVPDGPTTRMMQKIAAKHRMVIVVPVYESTPTAAISANTASTTFRTAILDSGRSSTSHPATAAIPYSRQNTRASAFTFATTAISPRVRAFWG
jgi:predicted amidohydrolase